MASSASVSASGHKVGAGPQRSPFPPQRAPTAFLLLLASVATARTLHETAFVRHPGAASVSVAPVGELETGAVFAEEAPSTASSPRSSSTTYDPEAVTDRSRSYAAALESTLASTVDSLAAAAAPVETAAAAVQRTAAGVGAAAARAAPSVQSFVATAKEATADLEGAASGGGAVTGAAARSFAERTGAAAANVAASLADGFKEGAVAGAPALAPGASLRSAVAAAVAGSVAAKDASGPVLGEYGDR